MTTTATTLRRLVQSIIVAGTGAVVAFGGSAHAATTQSFQISPPTANYAADPGNNVQGSIKVTNLTGEPIALNVGRQNFVAKGEEGEIELVDNANPLYSLAPWFGVPTGVIEVAPRSTVVVPYTIDIPVNAEPGGRYGSIIFSSIPPKLPSGVSGAAIQQTIAAIIFQRINGAALENLEMASFRPDNAFSEYGPVTLSTRIKNTGNVHEKPTGTIKIKDMLGFTVSTLKLDEHFVIPGAIRHLKNVYPANGKKTIMFGKYTATLNATYADGKKLTASTTFTVLPWKIMAGVLIVLIILFILFWKGRQRFGRAFRILAGRE